MKKTPNAFLLLSFFCAVLFYSCEKNTVEIENNNDAQGPYQSLADFYNQRGTVAEVFTMDPTQFTVIIGALGIQIYIPANSLFDSLSHPPSGPVTCTLREIYNIKDMVLSHAPSTSNGNILESGGILYLDFYANPIHYKAVYPTVSMPTASLQSGMKIFFGAHDPNTGINWTPADTNTNYVTQDSTGIGLAYGLIVDSVGGWINCAHPHSTAPVTDVTVIPQVSSWRGETVDIAVYLLFPSINSCMNVNNTVGPQAVTANNIPIGMNAWAAAIGIGRVSKKSYFGMVNFTVTSGQPVNVSLTQADGEIITALQSVL
jgi:hypothetical protein